MTGPDRISVLRNKFVVALVAWTVLVWTTRIGNIWSDSDLDTAGKLGRTALALSFTVLAVAVVFADWRARAATARRAVLALAAWTTAVWAVRSVAILVGSWSAGFKAVHTALAAISIALSYLALRTTRQPTSEYASFRADVDRVVEQGPT